jgi:hypothetical protein
MSRDRFSTYEVVWEEKNIEVGTARCDVVAKDIDQALRRWRSDHKKVALRHIKGIWRVSR